jgi:flagellar protein FlaG
VAELNQYVQNLERKLQFSVDDTSGDTVVRVIDKETDELIRQIPSEELLEVKHAIDEYRGILFETKA